jgi:pimeloyl-ACP methyl ester carboxylesterase
MSCGGLVAVNFAAKYPEHVSALYLDAPVMNLLSCPAGLGKADNGMLPEFIKATGMSLSELICYREHPIDKMQLLLENRIPVILLYGDSDNIVPYEENGAVLEKYYRENGGTIVSIGRVNCAHHPHGLDDNTPVIEFVEKFST